MFKRLGLRKMDQLNNSEDRPPLHECDIEDRLPSSNDDRYFMPRKDMSVLISPIAPKNKQHHQNLSSELPNLSGQDSFSTSSDDDSDAILTPSTPSPTLQSVKCSSDAAAGNEVKRRHTFSPQSVTIMLSAGAILGPIMAAAKDYLTASLISLYEWTTGFFSAPLSVASLCGLVACTSIAIAATMLVHKATIQTDKPGPSFVDAAVNITGIALYGIGHIVGYLSKPLIKGIVDGYQE